MAQSITYHVVGLTKVAIHTGVKQEGNAYGCMTKVEMLQAIRRANDAGLPIVVWLAQTIQGEKMLDLKHMPKMVDCPICEGHGCVVCNYSTITTPKHWEKWLPWQLERIHADAIIRDTPDAALD